MQFFLDIFPCYISVLYFYVIFLYYILCCFFVLFFWAICLCCIFVLYFCVAFSCCIFLLYVCVLFSCYLFVLYFCVIFYVLYNMRLAIIIACPPTDPFLVFVSGLHRFLLSCLGCLKLFSHCELFGCSIFLVLF